MNGREFWALNTLSNEELEASLNGLLGVGARVEARIVAHLAEVEARRLHLLAGFSSLYDYCRKRLGLSDYEAFVRITVARVARKFPVIFGMLERRELHLTAICEVRDFLCDENHAELLAEVSGKTKLQIRELLARWFPQADVRTSLTKLPAIEPLSPGRYRLLLTLSAEQKAKLELARDLMSHANRTGDLAVVVERALDELISRLEKRRFAQTSAQPKRDDANGCDDAAKRHHAQVAVNSAETSAASAKTVGLPGAIVRSAKQDCTQRSVTKAASKRRSHIANDVRRQLLARDGCCCAFVSDDGRRCDARAFLQFHHRQAWAHGGADSADNLALFCQAHNRLAAERDFGATRINEAIAHHAASALAGQGAVRRTATKQGNVRPGASGQGNKGP